MNGRKSTQEKAYSETNVDFSSFRSRRDPFKTTEAHIWQGLGKGISFLVHATLVQHANPYFVKKFSRIRWCVTIGVVLMYKLFN